MVEKLFLHFVAINFHQQALADRLVENQLGLRALDHLSRSPYFRKGQRQQHGYQSSSELLSNTGGHKRVGSEASPSSASPNKGSKYPTSNYSKKRRNGRGMATVIVDQVSMHPGFVFHLWTNYCNRSLGKRLARSLLRTPSLTKTLIWLGSTLPEGLLANYLRLSAMSTLHGLTLLWKVRFPSHKEKLFLIILPDFYPYFRSTTEAVSVYLAQLPTYSHSSG